MTDTPPDPAQLARELEETRDREARYRLKVAQDFLVLQTQLKAHRGRIDEINDELGRRNTYIHELHGERASFDEREQRLHGDLQSLMLRLAAAEDEASALRQQLARMKATWGWELAAPLRKLQKKFAPRPVPPTPVADGVDRGVRFTYYLKTSPFRLYRGTDFTLRGWAFPVDGRAVTAVRIRVDDREFIGRAGLAEPDVVAQHGPLPRNPAPGFEITFATPAGRHRWSLEAQLDHQAWACILETPIWCEPAPTAP